MSAKRSLVRNTTKYKSENLSNEIRVLIQNAQIALKSCVYPLAIQLSQKLESLLKDNPERSSYYLSSILWQIRAYQALKDTNSLERRIQDYIDESLRLNHAQHLIQAYRLRTQCQIDSADFNAAVETLESAITAAIDIHDAKNAFELLMHISSLELNLCRYSDAKDHLMMAMSMIDDVNLSSDKFSEVMSMGYRQLCELFIKIGDGESAVESLQLAMASKITDLEENCLQMLLYSRIKKQAGDLKESLQMIQSVDNIIQNSPEYPNRHHQLDSVRLEMAQLHWDCGEYDRALEEIGSIHTDNVSLQRAIALTRYQWAVSAGIPGCDPDKAESDFRNMPVPDDETDRSLQFAAELTQNALLIMRGQYKTARENLKHLAEKSSFLELMPICTKANQLIAEIDLARRDYLKAAEELVDVAKNYLEQCDQVSTNYVMALTLRAQYEEMASSVNGDTVTLKSEDETVLNELFTDCDKYIEQNYIEAFLDLALQLSFYTYRIGYIGKCKELVQKISGYIQPDKMAYRAMRYYWLKYELEHDDSLLQKVKDIAQMNQFRMIK